MSSSTLINFLSANLSSFPFLVVYLVGILICILRWKIHPNVSLYSLIAFSLFLIAWVVNCFLSFLLIRAADSGSGISSMMQVHGWVRLFSTGLDIVGWSLLIITNFFLRPAASGFPPANQPSYPPYR